MGGGHIHQLVFASFGIYCHFGDLDTEAICGGYHTLAVGSIVPPTDDDLAITTPYCLFNDIKIREPPFRTVSQVNPSVFDIQVINNVGSHLGGSKLQELTLGVGCCHLDRIAVHQCCPTTPGTEVNRTNTGISGMYPDILKMYPQLFGTNHAQRGIRALANITGSSKKVNFTINIYPD